MQIVSNRSTAQFQQVGRVSRGRRGQRQVRRDFGVRPQPGAGVPSGSRFIAGTRQYRMAGTRQYQSIGQVTPQLSRYQPRVINRFGALAIGRDEQFLLQTAIGGLAAFGGAFFGAKSGVTSQAGKTAGQGESPALNSLLSDAAAAAGLEQTSKALRPTAPKKPLSTTTKAAIGVGGVGALALLFLL